MFCPHGAAFCVDGDHSSQLKSPESVHYDARAVMRMNQHIWDPQVVSVDGLQPEHDKRRSPATYERILKHIVGHRTTIHCTITKTAVAAPWVFAGLCEFLVRAQGGPNDLVQPFYAAARTAFRGTAVAPRSRKRHFRACPCVRTCPKSVHA
jgi:hypothetical protein